jgi:hypothetical protein
MATNCGQVRGVWGRMRRYTTTRWGQMHLDARRTFPALRVKTARKEPSGLNAKVKLGLDLSDEVTTFGHSTKLVVFVTRDQTLMKRPKSETTRTDRLSGQKHACICHVRDTHRCQRL